MADAVRGRKPAQGRALVPCESESSRCASAKRVDADRPRSKTCLPSSRKGALAYGHRRGRRSPAPGPAGAASEGRARMTTALANPFRPQDLLQQKWRSLAPPLPDHPDHRHIGLGPRGASSPRSVRLADARTREKRADGGCPRTERQKRCRIRRGPSRSRAPIGAAGVGRVAVTGRGGASSEGPGIRGRPSKRPTVGGSMTRPIQCVPGANRTSGSSLTGVRRLTPSVPPSSSTNRPSRA